MALRSGGWHGHELRVADVRLDHGGALPGADQDPPSTLDHRLGVDESVMWGDYWFLDALDVVANTAVVR